MTIALGILADDGVVIAADTEESSGYAGGTKTTGNKIRTLGVKGGSGQPYRAIAVSGAGTSSFLDSIHQEVTAAWFKEKDRAKVETALKSTVKRFYDEHIQPGYLAGRDNMLLYQIIGMSWRSGQGVLLATDHGATWRSKDYIAVGAGREHASILLSQIMPEARPLPAERAAYLAAYVIYQVKEYIEGCGKKTQVVVLKHGKGEYLSKEKIALLEYRFGSYSDLNTLSLNYILGRPVKDEKAAAETLAKYLSLIRRDNKTLSHQTVTSQGWSLDWNDIQRQSSGPAPLPVEATIKSTAKLYPPSMSGGDTPLPLRQEAEEKTK